MNVSPYLKKHGVKETLSKLPKTQEESEAWDEFIQGLASEIVKDIETDLRNVNEMATEDGILACLEMAGQAGIRPQKSIESLAGPYNQALFFFLNHPEVIEDTSLHHVTDLKTKVEHFSRQKNGHSNRVPYSPGLRIQPGFCNRTRHSTKNPGLFLPQNAQP